MVGVPVGAFARPSRRDLRSTMRFAFCKSDDTLREAYNANLPKVTRFGSALGQNLALYQQYRALADAPEAAPRGEGGGSADASPAPERAAVDRLVGELEEEDLLAGDVLDG